LSFVRAFCQQRALTSLNLMYNQIGDSGTAALREIAKGRPALTLELSGN
jgi:hypothetical protein